MVNIHLNTSKKSYSANYRTRLHFEIGVILLNRPVSQLQVLFEVQDDDTRLAAALQCTLYLFLVLLLLLACK